MILKIDLANPQEVEQAYKMLQVIVFNNEHPEVKREIPDEIRMKVRNVPDKPIENGQAVMDAAEQPEVNIEVLRKLVRVKAVENRDAVVKKLKQFKAPNISTLAAEHYQEMYEFLNGLK